MAALSIRFGDLPRAQRRPLLMFVLALTALLLLYRETAVAMVGIWIRSETFAHAFLVPPISLWLVWRNRARLTALQPRPAPIWLLPLAVMAVLWLLGDLVVVNALTQFAVVAMIVLLVPLIFGWPTTQALSFPLLFLFFCVPVGEFLLPVLMESTADFTVAAVRLSGIPVFREGQQFVIPSGAWSVVEACSGVRYLIASLMVGSLFAYLTYQSTIRRLIFIGVSIVVPIVANWVRAYIIVMLGHLSDNRIATGVDHLIYGWVFFGVVIMIMFMIGSRWTEPDRRPAAAAQEEPRGLGAAIDPCGSAWLSVMVGAALLITLPPLIVHVLDSRQASGPVELSAAAVQTPWHIEDAGANAWKPAFVGATSEVNTVYRRQAQTVGAYIGYYRNQGDQGKLVSSVNVLVPSDDRIWHPVGSGMQETPLDGQTVRWRITHLLGAQGGISAQRMHRTVWQTYWVDDGFQAGDMAAKLQGAIGQLKGHGDDSAVVILYTELPPDEGGNALLAEFAAKYLVTIQDTLRQARDAH
jgi:exosortase A